MHTNEKFWFEQHRRWMRPDAHLRVRPDAQKWLPAGVSHPALPLPDERKSGLTPGTGAHAMNEVGGSAVTEADWLELRAMISDLKLDFRLACLRRKYSPDQPRVPAGNSDGGQWANGGGGAAPAARPAAARPAAAPPAATPARTRLAAATDPTVMSDAPLPGIPAMQSAEPVADRSGSRSGATPTDVVLPDGSKVPDRYSPTGYLQSPYSDASAVAAAGRETGLTYRLLLDDPRTARGAFGYLVTSLGLHVGTGGTFDYQREGNFITGFTQYPEFRNVSNFNVGLYMYQASFSLDETLRIAGLFASIASSNAAPAEPYGLDPRTREFIELGFRTGESGVFARSR